MKKFETLEINCTQLTELPSSFPALINLQHLIMTGCTSLRELPDSFINLINLKSLSFSHTGLERLPESIGALKQLKALNLSNCSRLESLPKSIGELKNLVALLLSGCSQLRTIPEEICNLQRFNKIKLTEPHGQLLPVGKSVHLLPQDASIEEVKRYLANWVKESPIAERSAREGVAKSTEHFLQSKDNAFALQGPFSTLPSIFHTDLFKHKLTHLSLRGCTQLTEIPPTLYMLDQLQVLNLSGCTQLTELPEGIHQLTHLEVLDLSGCVQFFKFPSTLTHLSHLKVFDVQGCVLLTASEKIGKRQVIEEGANARKPWFSILSQTPSSILYEVTPGKPARNNTCVCQEPMTLEARTIQPKQKGGTCWYYTFNYLRERVGKGGEGCEVHQDRRQAEKAISNVRKKITIYENNLRWCFQIDANPLLKKWLTTIDQDGARALINEGEISKNEVFKKNFVECYGLTIQKFDKMKGSTKGFLTIERHQLFENLKEFLNAPTEERTNFHAFLVQKRELGKKEIRDDYLKQVLPEYGQIMGICQKKLGPAELLKHHGNDRVFLAEVARSYQLHYSDWSPDQGMGSLITELKQTGPVAVFGFIGTPYYKELPVLTSEEFDGRHTYCWNPDARTQDFSSSAHAILLVGAKQEPEGEFVYFIDPNNVSDPSNRESQRIYRMPYQELINYMTPIASPYLDKETQPPAFFTPYAYCRG